VNWTITGTDFTSIEVTIRSPNSSISPVVTQLTDTSLRTFTTPPMVGGGIHRATVRLYQGTTVLSTQETTINVNIYSGTSTTTTTTAAPTTTTTTTAAPTITTTTTRAPTSTTTTTTAPPTNHISGFASGTGCYFAKSGFSLDRIAGDIWLTAGTVPQISNGSTCGSNANVPWELLKFRGTGTNQLSNDNTSNIYQLTNGLYAQWGMMDSINISAIPIGSSGNLTHSTYSVTVNGAGWPFAFGNPNYIVRRTGANSATIELGQNAAWGTGDNGWNVTIGAWFSLTNISFGGADQVMGLDGDGNPVELSPFVKGVKTLTW
jgi:hypothetical protein